MKKLKLCFNSNLVAIAIRLAFVICLLVGERMFLGEITRSRGRADLVTSAGMILFLLLAIEMLPFKKIKDIILVCFAGVLIFFQLVAGLYYRFFHCAMPIDIIYQWQDLFVVGDYGISLLSWLEILIAVIIPVLLLICFFLKPVKTKSYVFILLLAVIAFGWNHRLNRSVFRSGDEMSSLPDYIHRQFFFWNNIGAGKDRFRQLTNNLDAAIPRNLKGYKQTKGNGLLVEPIDPVKKSDQKRYNIILILMESVRAYECGFLGANPSFTPGLDELTKNALVYNNFYANASQTARAEFTSLCSIYTNPIGVPDYLVNPNINVISLPEILCDSGYDTLWFSGFTASHHNKGTFLSRHGIKKIYDRDVLPKAKEPEIGWGMNDCEMFENVWGMLKDSKTPFFAQITTLSNHVSKDNLEYPTSAETPVTNESDSLVKYQQGIYYTDYAVSRFIKKVLDSSLAKNTVIIAMSDHGRWIFPKDVHETAQKLEIMFRVPLCIWGPKDLVTPGQDSTLGSQIDLSPTLLELLGIKHKNTFLGQSLNNQDISPDQRYVLTFLGSIAHIRVGDVVSISKTRLDGTISDDLVNFAGVERMGAYKKDSCDFLTIDGDLLRNKYTATSFKDENKINAFYKRIDDIVFLTSYGLYMNAYEGIDN